MLNNLKHIQSDAYNFEILGGNYLYLLNTFPYKQKPIWKSYLNKLNVHNGEKSVVDCSFQLFIFQ